MGLLVAAMLAQGVFFALYLVPWEDESGYLFLGDLAVRGEIRLYQDEMLGERMPIPFYLLGASQLVAGPSLLAARLTSLALGGAALMLTYAVGRTISGPIGGALGALFLATHGMIVGYWATAMYHSLCAVIVLLGLYLLHVRRSPLLAMTAFSALSLTRPNVAVMVPLVLTILWLECRRPWDRWCLVAVTVLPPLAFFIWNTEHLKLLAYVPGVATLVRPLGYQSLFPLGAENLVPDRAWSHGLTWFAQRYRFWCLAGAALTLAWWLARWRAGRPLSEKCPAARRIALLFVYTLAWQVLILRVFPKSVAAWTASFAPLVALLLGHYGARILESDAAPILLRRAVVAGLTSVFLLSPTFSRHANMPAPLPTASTTIGVVDEVAREMGTVIPAGSRVFLVGMSVTAYLARTRPYLQQIIHSWTLVPRGDPRVLARSGLWGRQNIIAWLGQDAPYAIVQPSWLAEYRARPAYDELAQLVEAGLASHFTLVREIDLYPVGAYRVYRRRA